MHRVLILVFSKLGLIHLFVTVGSVLANFVSLSNHNVLQNVNIDTAQIVVQIRSVALLATLWYSLCWSQLLGVAWYQKRTARLHP
jgi:hypothetical protein